MKTNTYTITTEAATRSIARRTMTHTIEAATEADAIFEARMRHIARCGWNVSVWIASVRA